MFETKVLEIAKKVAPLMSSEMYNGTLFVECGTKEAEKITTLLLDLQFLHSREFKKLVVSGASGFFAFDFA